MHLFSTISFALLAAVVAASPLESRQPNVSPKCSYSSGGSKIIDGRKCKITYHADRPGGDYAAQHTGSFQACIKLCASQNQCRTAQYHEENGYCYLKNSINALTASCGTDSVDCAPSPIKYTTTTTTTTKTTCPVTTKTTSSSTKISSCPAKTTTATVVSTISSGAITTTRATSTLTVTVTGSASSTVTTTTTITSSTQVEVTTVDSTNTITLPGSTVTATNTITTTDTETDTTTATSTITIPLSPLKRRQIAQGLNKEKRSVPVSTGCATTTVTVSKFTTVPASTATSIATSTITVTVAPTSTSTSTTTFTTTQTVIITVPTFITTTQAPSTVTTDTTTTTTTTTVSAASSAVVTDLTSFNLIISTPGAADTGFFAYLTPPDGMYVDYHSSSIKFQASPIGAANFVFSQNNNSLISIDQATQGFFGVYQDFSSYLGGAYSGPVYIANSAYVESIYAATQLICSISQDLEFTCEYGNAPGIFFLCGGIVRIASTTLEVSQTACGYGNSNDNQIITLSAVTL